MWKTDYEKIWRILADLITDFMKRGETIPPNIIKDLRSAKTMIEILKLDPKHVEYMADIEEYLGNVESFLVFTAHKKFGEEYVNQWMKKLKEAKMKIKEEFEKETRIKALPVLPRGKNWIRVQVSEEIREPEVKKLAEETGLSYKIQTNGYILISGEHEKIKNFVKKMAEKFKGAR